MDWGEKARPNEQKGVFAYQSDCVSHGTMGAVPQADSDSIPLQALHHREGGSKRGHLVRTRSIEARGVQWKPTSIVGWSCSEAPLDGLGTDWRGTAGANHVDCR